MDSDSVVVQSYLVRTVAGDDVARKLFTDDLMALLLATKPQFVVDVNGNETLLNYAKDANLPEIVASAYPGLDPRLIPAASGSVWAHLMDLERRGLVLSNGETWTSPR